ncbi:MAG: hypothetical protein PHD70_01680 [Anaerostipes sp.]|nr:hypothetical protein [Anaerostipes sp.]
MLTRKNQRHAYRPSDNKISPISMISTIIGLAGIVLYFILIRMSASQRGNLSIGYGIIPWIIFVASGIGVFFAYKSLKDTVTVRRWKVLGGITNVFLVVFTLIIFLRGVI